MTEQIAPINPSSSEENLPSELEQLSQKYYQGSAQVGDLVYRAFQMLKDAYKIMKVSEELNQKAGEIKKQELPKVGA